MVTNKLYLDARNNDYIVRCKLGSHTISGCSVTGVGPPETPPPVQGSKKKPGLNRVNVPIMLINTKLDTYDITRNSGIVFFSKGVFIGASVHCQRRQRNQKQEVREKVYSKCQPTKLFPVRQKSDKN